MDPPRLRETHSLPLLVEPARGIDPNAAALAAWAAVHRETLDRWLHRAGALLLRGFGIGSAGALRAVAQAIRPELRNYVGGDSPRTAVGDRIYTSTEFPPDRRIGLHNELSYAGWWPQRLFFCCLVAAESGGETPLADGRKVYAALDPEVRDRFASRGVTYYQHLRDAAGASGPGKSWQDTFETVDRQAAERICREQGLGLRWTARGLRTESHRAAVVRHPVTGESCWFNQADLWHATFDSLKAGEPAIEGEDPIGCHARYGDGSEIPALDLEAVRGAYRASETAFPWRAGDLLVVDNHLALHGRRPYRGERRVLVAMA